MKLSFFQILAITLAGIGVAMALPHIWIDLSILLHMLRNLSQTAIIELILINIFLAAAIVLLVCLVVQVIKKRYATSALYGLALIALPFVQAFCFLLLYAVPD